MLVNIRQLHFPIQDCLYGCVGIGIEVYTVFLGPQAQQLPDNQSSRCLLMPPGNLPGLYAGGFRVDIGVRY